MTLYEIILQDLLREGTEDHIMQEVPYTSEMDYLTKIQVTYRCLLRAQRFKQRKSALVFAYFIIQPIETKELSKRQVRQVITEHFYVIAVRTYYIFEIRPMQIYNTEHTTINMIMYLKQSDVRRLVLEL
jgi:hypothetical protein